MATLNKVILIGHLGRDPELRYMASGDAVTHLALATSERWHDKASGEKKEITEWHRVVLYRKLAEIAEQYLHKGSLAYIEGHLHTRKWADKNGAERTVTEIIGDDLRLIEPRAVANHGEGRAPATSDAPAKTSRRPAPLEEEDHIPF